MKLIIGLGNPGKEYENTRHNVGFMALDKIAEANHASFNMNKMNGNYTIFEHNNQKILLLKPLTYMNLSGEAVIQFINYYKINIEDILVISDDLDTELGKIKLKYKGSSGGHNGLKNIELHLKTKEYKRLKIGISKNKNFDMKDYVLGKFAKEEKEKIESVLNTVIDIFDDFCTISFENVMNKYNKK